MLNLGAGGESCSVTSSPISAVPTTSFPFLLAVPGPLSITTCLVSGVVALLKSLEADGWNRLCTRAARYWASKLENSLGLRKHRAAGLPGWVSFHALSTPHVRVFSSRWQIRQLRKTEAVWFAQSHDFEKWRNPSLNPAPLSSNPVLLLFHKMLLNFPGLLGSLPP